MASDLPVHDRSIRPPPRPGARRPAAVAGALGAVTLAFACGPPPADGPEGPAYHFRVPDTEGLTWYKGNTHTHTTESDGDSPPEVVARWYRDHGYDFLVLSDHNVFTDPADYAEITDSTFLLIPGEEVSSSFDSRPVHVNGLGIPGVVEPRVAESLVATIQANVDAVREVEGVPHVNHPNFGWAFGAEELARVENDRLLEIFNGHPTVHNRGGGGTPGLEEVWDVLLTGGKVIYGIAVDDAHHFRGEFGPERANPGRGWIAVRASSLNAAEILRNLEEGLFYASTGVELTDVVVTTTRLEVHIEQDRNFRYTTHFIGPGGRVVHTSVENPAVFELGPGDGVPGGLQAGMLDGSSGEEAPAGEGEARRGYVRAKVVDSRGDVAWVQPVFLEEAGG